MNRPKDLQGYETLIGLVERYSPTGEESAAVEWLVRRMQDLGFTEARVDGAGSAVGLMGTGPRQGILLGHIDTVRGEIPPRIEGELLFGRGAVDAKGPLAAFVDAVADVGPVDGWQWIVVGAVDEEGDSRGARFLLDKVRPAFAIVGEPSRWDRVTIGYKGSAWSKATIRRPMAHAASPQVSACEGAVEYWEAIRAWVAEFNRDRPRAFDQVTPSLRGWSSGDDGFQGWASLQLGTRLPPGLAPDEWHARLRFLDPGVDVEFGRLRHAGLSRGKELQSHTRIPRRHPAGGRRPVVPGQDRNRRPESRGPGVVLLGRGLRPGRLVPRPHTRRAHPADRIRSRP